MHQQTELLKNPVSAEKNERIKKLVEEIKEANKDPKFRATVKEFIKRHTE